MGSGSRKPTNFICLILKMLQIQPDRQIIVELIRNESYKYVRLLGAFYMRLCGRSVEIYRYLEPLYNDYRKIRVRTREETFVLSYVDVIVDDLLRKDVMFDTVVPRIQYRHVLEECGFIDRRTSLLQNDFKSEEKTK